MTDTWSVVRLNHPFTMIVAGMQSSGKTTFIQALIRQRNELFSPPVEKVFYHYAIWQPLFENQSDPNVHYQEGVPNIDEIPENCLLVLDDLLSQMSNDKNLMDLFCVKSHHRSISVIFVTQSFFLDSMVYRVCTRNASYLIFFRSQRISSVIEHLSRQLWPHRRGFLLDAYNKATRNKSYSYIFLNLHPASEEKLSVLTDILPSEGYTRVFV